MAWAKISYGRSVQKGYYDPQVTWQYIAKSQSCAANNLVANISYNVNLQGSCDVRGPLWDHIFIDLYYKISGFS